MSSPIKPNLWTEATNEDWIGAQDFQDCQDIKEVLTAFGEKFSGRVIEIGCGTGRISQLCKEYVGYDISPPFVEIAKSRDVDARLLPVPEDEQGDWLVITHVLCHLPRHERLAYLKLNIAPKLFVDYIDGDSGQYVMGHPPIYLLREDTFLGELAEAGWTVTKGPYIRPESTYRHSHRYFVCEK